jgi:hypothetical protein
LAGQQTDRGPQRDHAFGQLGDGICEFSLLTPDIALSPGLGRSPPRPRGRDPAHRRRVAGGGAAGGWLRLGSAGRGWLLSAAPPAPISEACSRCSNRPRNDPAIKPAGRDAVSITELFNEPF